MSTSCKTKQQNEEILTSKTLLNKTITFPNSLTELDGIEFHKTDSLKLEETTKIISIIDGNCMKCIITQLNKLDSIFNDILHDKKSTLIFILNVHPDDSVFFMNNLQPAINASATILWDNNYNFERTNDLFTPDINLRTFMVNENNKIIQYGNPILHPNILSKYSEKLGDINSTTMD